MQFRQIIIIAAILSSTVITCWAEQQIMETQIGPFTLADTLTESKFISEFGQGYVQINKVDKEILEKQHIYYASDSKVWVKIGFSHVLDAKLERDVETILVTKVKLCDKKFKPKRSFGPLVTSKGIKIGDPENKVIKTYGKPSVYIHIEKDKLFSALAEDIKFSQGRILRYLPHQPDDLLFSEFYFDKEGLNSILISVSE